MTNDERIEYLLKERGYIVLASSPFKTIKIGHIIDNIAGSLGGKLSQPFCVIEQTNYNDAVNQHKILIQYGDEGNIEDIRETDNFYKLTTD